MTADQAPGPGRTWDRHAYRILAASAVGVLAVATVAYRLMEDWSWVDSFYFSAIAVTTVGFGDLTPTTDSAKLFTVFYIVVGIALIASFLNVRLQRHARRLSNRG